MQARTSDEGYRGIPHGQAPFRDDHVVQDLVLPASTSCRVMARSSGLGSSLPEGWLWATMIPAARSAMASATPPGDGFGSSPTGLR